MRHCAHLQGIMNADRYIVNMSARLIDYVRCIADSAGDLGCRMCDSHASGEFRRWRATRLVRTVSLLYDRTISAAIGSRGRGLTIALIGFSRGGLLPGLFIIVTSRGRQRGGELFSFARRRAIVVTSILHVTIFTHIAVRRQYRHSQASQRAH